MYKKTSKSNIRLRFVTPSKKAKDEKISEFTREVRSARRFARSFLKEERLKRIFFNCEECKKQILCKYKSSHYYKFHDISTCKFCKELIPNAELHKHIKKTHGVNTYDMWLKLKKPKSNKVKSIKISVIDNYPHIKLPFFSNCLDCGQVIDLNQIEAHQNTFCKKPVFK